MPKTTLLAAARIDIITTSIAVAMATAGIPCDIKAADSISHRLVRIPDDRSFDVMAHSILTIVIPALNEEAAIGDTIARCLAACDQIQQAASLDDVEIIVVSDGSTDRTAEIASGFSEVKTIVFEKNRGYGAAIKVGWGKGSGDLLGFLDADGTCDPIYFAEMARVAIDESADVVLGSRLGRDSKMPPIRRIGNRLYAFLLGLLCGQQVTDTASGMRVVSRRSLDWLYPLPDGLHFTPSMSAHALLNGLRVIEIPMRYAERVGRSKLSVVKDGLRFLKTIFAGVLCYQPERFLLAAFLVCLGALVVLAIYPAEFYLHHRHLEEWMLYRFVVCFVLGIFCFLLLLATALVHQIAKFGPRRRSANSFWPSSIARIFTGRSLLMLVVCLLILTLWFLWPGISEFLHTRQTTLHWSRLLAGAFTLLAALQAAVYSLILQSLSTWDAIRQPKRPDHDRHDRRFSPD